MREVWILKTKKLGLRLNKLLEGPKSKKREKII
jgi:hypothetical protein